MSKVCSDFLISTSRQIAGYLQFYTKGMKTKNLIELLFCIQPVRVSLKLMHGRTFICSERNEGVLLSLSPSPVTREKKNVRKKWPREILGAGRILRGHFFLILFSASRTALRHARLGGALQVYKSEPLQLPTIQDQT